MKGSQWGRTKEIITHACYCSNFLKGNFLSTEREETPTLWVRAKKRQTESQGRVRSMWHGTWAALEASAGSAKCSERCFTGVSWEQLSPTTPQNPRWCHKYLKIDHRYSTILIHRWEDGNEKSLVSKFRQSIHTCQNIKSDLGDKLQEADLRVPGECVASWETRRLPEKEGNSAAPWSQSGVLAGCQKMDLHSKEGLSWAMAQWPKTNGAFWQSPN